MRPSQQYSEFVEERVTVLTVGERIEGVLCYIGATRLSDFLKAPFQRDSKFLKVKNPRVYCRHSGEEINRVPFLMLARDRIVMMMTHSASESDEPARSKTPSGQFVREAAAATDC